MNSKLRKAIKLLLDAGYVLKPDALDVLAETSDAVGVAMAFLNKFANKKQKIIGYDDLIKCSHPIQPSLAKIPPKSIDHRITEGMQYDSLRPYHKLQNGPFFAPNAKIVNQQPQTRKYAPIANNYGNSILRTMDEDLTGLPSFEPDVEIVWQPKFSATNLGHINDFVQYFNNRYHKIKSIFSNRSDISHLVPIKELANMREESVSVIGMVTDKQFPSNGGGLLTLEDPSFEYPIQAVISKSKPELVEQALHIMNDSVIAINGYLIDHMTISINEIILPDIPKMKKLNRADLPVHVAFLSDIHIGSKGFISPAFENFIKFLNGEFGNSKMKKIGIQTKYVLFAGDVVDGVGVYPNHESELSIDDIREQYDVFASYLELIPPDVTIIVIPGNHDHVRPAEPQPAISPDHAKKMLSLDNVINLPNPSQVQMHGVETLLYHCTSLPDIINHIPGLNIKKPVEVMIKMLQARHLAPIWDSRTPIAPEPEDFLVIERVPDLFHGGHIHINDLGNYNGVTILNSGTMQAQTSYQKALNILPTPGEVLVMNLKTFQPNLLRLLPNT